MEYRGEDASRTRAASRRQPPWQSSSGTGPEATGPWNDGARGYGQDDGYAAADGYDGYATGDGYGGYGSADPYAGYEDYGQGAGYGDPQGYATGQGGAYPDGGGGYLQGNGYAASDSYGGGYGAGYGAGYGQGNGYPAGDDYAGGGYDQDGAYGRDIAYGRPESYGQQAGYGDTGYGEGYAGGGYGSGPHHQLQAGGGPDGSYFDGGYGGGPYDQPQAGGGYDPDPYGRSSYGRSGGYPALGTGSGGRAGAAGGYRDAGNDWYADQPQAASGSGFADTGILSARAIDSYGTGPRPLGAPGGYDHDQYDQRGYDDGYQDDLSQAAARDPARGFPPAPGRQPSQLEAASPQGLAYTGQQERYDDSQYEAYSGYGGRRGLGDPRGYGAVGGYDASPRYDQYAEPQDFVVGGYGTGPGYDDYDNAPDPYQERYGGGTGPRPGGRGGGRGGKGRKRGKRRLLLSALGVVAVAVLAAAAYTLVLKPKPSAGTSVPSAGPLPTSGSTSAATAACEKLGQYCHIESRTDDPVPLTVAELYPPAFTNETDHTSFLRIATRLDKTCANAVIGQDLINALQSDSCTQVVRASYVSGDNEIMGTIGVVNLATTKEAHLAGEVVGANDFIAPLSTSSGIGAKLGSGTGVVEAEFKGHYLILTWAEFTNGNAPSTAAQDRQLEQFETDLVAGTANISLSQRMVTGAPASANG